MFPGCTSLTLPYHEPLPCLGELQPLAYSAPASGFRIVEVCFTPYRFDSSMHLYASRIMLISAQPFTEISRL